HEADQDPGLYRRSGRPAKAIAGRYQQLDLQPGVSHARGRSLARAGAAGRIQRHRGRWPDLLRFREAAVQVGEKFLAERRNDIRMKIVRAASWVCPSGANAPLPLDFSRRDSL